MGTPSGFLSRFEGGGGCLGERKGTKESKRKGEEGEEGTKEGRKEGMKRERKKGEVGKE